MNYRPEMIAIGKYATELSEYLASGDHQVEVVTTSPHYPGWRSFPSYSAWRYSSERLGCVKVWRAPMYLNAGASGLARLVMPLSLSITFTPVLWWRALFWRPDVIVLVQPTIMMAPSVLIAALIGRARTVQHVQDIEIDAALAVGHLRAPRALLRLVFLFERWLIRRFDRVVTISFHMRDVLIRKGVHPGRLTVIRNWVDTRAVYPLGRPSVYRAELGISVSAFVVQYSGQMGRKQSLGLIIDAAKHLQNDPRFVFVLAGDGPMRLEIEQAASALPNVIMLPLQPTARLGEFLNLADCHILPQDSGVSELVLPSKLGGMLASGKRVLVTADEHSELAHFLGDAAICTPPGDVDAVVFALTSMIDAVDEGASVRALRTRDLDAAMLLPGFERALTFL